MAFINTEQTQAGSQFLEGLKTVQNLCLMPIKHPQPLPRTTQERLLSSSEKTVLYLAYGSNLSSQTFRGVRGINPLSSVAVLVPSLRLTFDLAGIPYIEPCFANTAYRTPSNPPTTHDYNKDQWHKGLIGVVYEVTPEDYRTIIATEGGGASYHDVVVECYDLPRDSKIVDPIPSGTPFKAHTLLKPREPSSLSLAGPQRPDPSYAQPSQRYLDLITTGAEEHNLPAEYLAYLYQIRPYTITTKRQAAGKVLFLAIWGPIILLLSALGKAVADEEGKFPDWFTNIMGAVFAGLWWSYDELFKKIFGDGERTEEGDGDGEEERESLGEKGRIRLEEKEKCEVGLRVV